MNRKVTVVYASVEVFCRFCLFCYYSV